MSEERGRVRMMDEMMEQRLCLVLGIADGRLREGMEGGHVSERECAVAAYMYSRDHVCEVPGLTIDRDAKDGVHCKLTGAARAEKDVYVRDYCTCSASALRIAIVHGRVGCSDGQLGEHLSSSRHLSEHDRIHY